MEKNDFRIRIDRDEEGALYLPTDCCGACHYSELGIDLDSSDILTCRCVRRDLEVDPFKMRVNGKRCRDYFPASNARALEFLQGMAQIGNFVKSRRDAKTTSSWEKIRQGGL